MTLDESELQALRDLQASLDDAARTFAANSYTVPSVDASNESFTSGSWDASDATSSYPDPSDDDISISEFRTNYMFAPEQGQGSDDATSKSAYKGPLRESHAGAINTNALTALIQAINGARGGFDDLDDSTRRRGYNQAVELAVEAGVYDDKDEAPEFEAAQAGDGDDGSGSGSGSDSTAPPSIEASDSAMPFGGSIAASADSANSAMTDGLEGVIWAAGRHTLYVGGEPTTVHVPPETIEPTYNQLTERIGAGEATIGFDHPDASSVAAQTPLGEIGEMRDVALASDGERIVLTDSTLTNNKAIEAAAAGAFDGFEFSIVGDIQIASDAAGDPVRDDSGALEVAAVRIDRADVVPDGAVEGARIGQVPDLAAAVAAQAPTQPANGFVASLRAAAGGDDEHASPSPSPMSDSPNDQSPWNRTLESIEAARSALDDASDVVESKDETIEDLQAENAALADQAEAFRAVAASHGVDLDDEIGAEEIQEVVDAHTASVREEIAELEASSPNYDVDAEDVENRAAELQGEPIEDLEAMAGDRARDALRADTSHTQHSQAVAASEQTQTGPSPGAGAGSPSASGLDLSVAAGGGGGSVGGGGRGQNVDPDEFAEEALTGQDTLTIQASNVTPAQYLREQFGVEPTEYAEADQLRAAVREARNGGAGGGAE